MKIKCKDKGNTKYLTLDKEYEVLGKTDERYSIVNDNNEEKNYVHKLFEEVPEFEDIKDIKVENLSIKDGNGYMNLAINIHLNDKVFKYSRVSIFKFNGTNISCGVYQANDINTMWCMINDYLLPELKKFITASKFRTLTKDELIFIVNSIQEQWLASVKRIPSKVAFILVSTNITNNDYIHRLASTLGTSYDSILTPIREASLSVHQKLNPNSGNIIELYVLTKEK